MMFTSMIHTWVQLPVMSLLSVSSSPLPLWKVLSFWRFPICGNFPLKRFPICVNFPLWKCGNASTWSQWCWCLRFPFCALFSSAEPDRKIWLEKGKPKLKTSKLKPARLLRLAHQQFVEVLPPHSLRLARPCQLLLQCPPSHSLSTRRSILNWNTPCCLFGRLDHQVFHRLGTTRVSWKAISFVKICFMCFSCGDDDGQCPPKMCNNPALGLNETKGISGICSQVWIDNSFLSAHANTCFLKTILTHTISHTFLSAMQIHPQYDTCIQITWRYAAVGSPPSLQLTSLPQLQGQADPAASSVGIWPGSGVVSKSWDFFGSWYNDLCIWFCNRSADPTVWMLSGWGNVLLFFSQLLVAH